MHTGPITAVIVSKDGRYIFTGGYDRKIIAWDFNGNNHEIIGSHDHLVNCLALSNDGKLLACGSADYTISIYETQTRKLVNKLIGHADDVEAISFAKNGTLLISASNIHDNRILVWDVKTGRIIRQFSEHSKCVNSIWVCDNLVFSVADDGNVFKWDIDTGSIIDRLSTAEMDLDCISGDEARRKFAVGCDDGKVLFYNIDSLKLERELVAHERGVKKIVFSPSGQYFLTSGYDHSINIWKTDDYKLIRKLENQTYQWERSLAWTPDEKNIIGSSFGKTFCFWEVDSGKCVSSDNILATPSINDIAVSGNGTIVTASDDGVFRINGKDVLNRYGTLNNATCISLDGEFAIWGNHAGQVCLFNVHEHLLINTLNTNGPVNTIKYSQEKNAFYIGTYGGYIHEFSLSDRDIVKTIRAHNGAVKSLDLFGEMLVTGSSDGRIRVFDLRDWTHCELVVTPFIVNDLCFSTNGEYIAVVGRDKITRFIETKTGRVINQHRVHRFSIKSVAINSSDVVFAGDYWGHVSIWHPFSSEEPQLKRISPNGISAIRNLGEKVLAASWDGGIYSISETGATTVYFRLFKQIDEKILNFA
ncbi:WD40 repeat domain-containing protein [Alicyclobacillus tolerans]|uniref:WD40 repeat domain-containing protein n=1 Tax=Alicyclobacillus tolerans TaxID=90970 RepID=UPI003B77D456